MAYFDIELSVPPYSSHQGFVLNVCFCCLTRNEDMLKLTNCKHKDFLHDYLKLKCSAVCINCHNMLKKITKFRLQVQKSYELLQQGTYENTTKIVSLQRSDIILTSTLEDYEVKHVTSSKDNRSLNLNQQSVIDSSSTQMTTKIFIKEESARESPSFEMTTELQFKEEPAKESPIEMTSEIYLKEESARRSPFEITSELYHKEESTKESTSFETTTDIKIEHDLDKNLPLSQMKNKDTNNRARKDQMPSFEEKFSGKIGKLNLSKEELMLEREKETLSESYLKLPFKCESCIKGFEIENKLQAHNKTKHMRDGIKCDICYTVLNTESSYKKHYKEHVTRYVCVVCGKRSTSIYTIAHHYNNHHMDKEPIAMELSCSECDYTSNSHRSMAYHRYKHKPKPQCAECGKAFSTTECLRKHVDVVHKNIKRLFKCPVCDKAYRYNAGLLSHQASQGHGGLPVQSHYCAPCQKHFPTKGRLNHHLRTTSTHLTEESKRFVCHDCDAKFSTKNAIQTHIKWEHLKIIKHKCQKCHKVFKSAYDLKIHIDFVHDKKKLPKNKMCNYCGKGFSRAATLLAHIRTHTGERPLHCPQCPATFAHPAARYTHVKLLHKK